jgi:hypothetical protein
MIGPLGWLSLLSAALNGGGVVICTTFAAFHGRGWYVVQWIPFIAFTLVILVLCADMARELRSDARTPLPPVGLQR